MIYKEVQPSKDLQEYIQNYWKFEVVENSDKTFPIQHETLPENTMSLVFINQPYFNGIRIMGPHIEKYTQSLFPNAIFLGIRIQPWLNIHSLTTNKVDILNKTLPSSPEVENHFKELQLVTGFDNFTLFEKQVVSFLKRSTIQKNDMVKFICLQLNSGKSIAEITSQIPASTRVIQKKFKETTGLTMKQYANIERQRNTWKAIMLENKNPLDAIIDNGFYDQSHFINEFKKIMKRTHNDFQSYLASVHMEFH